MRRPPPIRTDNPNNGIPPDLRDDLQRFYEIRMHGTPEHQVVYVQNFFEGHVHGFMAKFVFNDGTRPQYASVEDLHAWLVSQGWFFHPAKVPLAIRRDMEADAQVRRLDGLPPTPQPASRSSKFPVKIEGTTP